jgi:hypothetical protein
MNGWTMHGCVDTVMCIQFWGRPAGRSALGRWFAFVPTYETGGRTSARPRLVTLRTNRSNASLCQCQSLQLQLISSCSRCRFCASYVLIIRRCARCTAACSILLRSLCPQGPAGHCLLSFTNIKELFAEDATSSIRHARCQANNRDRSLLPRNRYPYTTTCLGHRTGKHQAI